jgi:hypothetical protein
MLHGEGGNEVVDSAPDRHSDHLHPGAGRSLRAAEVAHGRLPDDV